MKSAIVVDTKDNVATLLDEVEPGDHVETRLGNEITEIAVKERIRFGHKFALRDIKKGEEVIKYGEIIGRMKVDVETGCHVHVHNVEETRARRAEEHG